MGTPGCRATRGRSLARHRCGRSWNWPPRAVRSGNNPGPSEFTEADIPSIRACDRSLSADVRQRDLEERRRLLPFQQHRMPDAKAADLPLGGWPFQTCRSDRSQQSMADDLLVSNVRPYGAEPTDILIRAGQIAGVGMTTPTAGVPVLDGMGKLAMPGLVEAHTHLDKSLLGMRGIAPRWAAPDRQDRERAPAEEECGDRSGAAVAAPCGALAVRTAPRISGRMSTWMTRCGVGGIEGVWRPESAYVELMDIDIVAFPQSGFWCGPARSS